MIEICSRCKFWGQSPDRKEVCQRFPKHEYHGAHDWCGEYRAKTVEIPDVPTGVTVKYGKGNK